jgi:pantetheine-phosphate adenylyltransferase
MYGMTAVYPGSFDPVTNGHLDIIRRAAEISDRLIVGLLVNPLKKSMFTVEERLMFLRLVTRDIKNAEVKFSDGLLMDFAREHGASVIIRGQRGNVIPEADFQIALGIKDISGVETLYMFPRPEFIYLSSTIVKEIAVGGGDIEGMVPPMIISDVHKKIGR